MAEGEILEAEEGVIREILEAEIQETREEEAPEEPHLVMTNYRANSQPSLKETDENPKVSCRNGTYITASIDIPLK